MGLINDIIVQLMDSDSHQASKLTITQLQAFLPLPPPKAASSLPTTIIQFLASPSFNNLSLKDQNRIQKSYSIAYRSYFRIEAVVEHIHSFTGHKFTDQSIIQAVTNAACKQGLINWYLFSRIVAGKHKKSSKISTAQAAEMIQTNYRTYYKKNLERAAYEAAYSLKKSLEERLLLQFQKEVKRQVFQHIQRNKVQSEQAFKQVEVQQLSFVQFQKLINVQLECGLEIKKLQYLFMAFEKRQRFILSQFKREMLPGQQKVSDIVVGHFMTIEDLFTLIHSYMTQSFYSWQDLVEKYKEYQPSDDQINLQKFYLFINSKCEAKISWIQAYLLKESLGIVGNIKYLFLKSNPAQLQTQASQLMVKKARRLALKKENPVFYQFRNILLLLVANCKAPKLTRVELGSFLTKYNPYLKHDAFYAVWRVYGDLINIQRIRQQLELNPFACHLFLTLGSQQYEALHEQLLQVFPPENEVPYSKVQEKINLSTNFLLESLHLRPLALQDSDTIDYRRAIAQIIPLSLQTSIRSYIFRKVSQKFVVLWRSIRAKKKRNQAIHKALVQQIISLQGKVPLEDKNAKKGSKIGKKNVSRASRLPTPPLQLPKRQKTEQQPEAFSICKDLLKQVIESVSIQTKQLISQGFIMKRQIVLSCLEQYSFRTSLTKVSFHWMLGTLACSREFLILEGGQAHRLKLKLPYRPGINPIEFVVWNNQLAVLTSLSSLELYPLGQQQIYPERTLQLSKKVINQKDIDMIVQQRLHRQMPWLLRPQGPKIIVNIIHSQELIFVDQDPTVPTFVVKLSFREHFIPQAGRNMISNILKRSPEERLDFIQKSLQKQKNWEYIQQMLPGFTAFQWLQWFDWLNNLGLMANYVLRTQLKVKKLRAIPVEVNALLQLLMQYMLERNLSVTDLLLEMGCNDEGISAKDLKKYLGKVVGYEAISQTTEGWLQGLSSGKKISYQQIVSLVSQKWAYSPVQKPSLIPKSFLLMPGLPILVYTLDGLGQIYLRNVKEGNLIASLSAHSETPIFHLIQEQMVLFSAEPSEQKGKDQLLLLWRLQQDILGKYQERPPWKIKPFLTFSTGHQAPITSISYSSHSDLLITASLDGSVKFWAINSFPFGLIEAKRIYTQNASFIQADIHKVFVNEGDVPIEKLITVKIGQQISTQNLLPYEATVDVCLLEPMSAKVPERLGSLPCPVRLVEKLAEEGKRKSIKKKALLGQWQREQIEKIQRGLLALKSLDYNFFGALKTAYIFQSQRQLRSLVDFVETKKYCEMVISKVLQQYGLGLIDDIEIQGLDSPPTLPVADFKASAQQQIYLEQDSLREIFQELNTLLAKSQLISQEKLLRIVKSHFYADLEARFLQIIKCLSENTLDHESQKNGERYYRISNIKNVLKEHPIKGAQGRMASAFRLLHRRLRKTRSNFWEFFTPSLAQLDRSKRIRTQEFTQKAKSLGLNNQHIEAITSYLSRNGTISLFEFLHYAKNAIQESNQSQLPNYSSIILGQSVVLQSEIRQKEDDPEPVEKSLHFQIREALQKKSSKVGSQSSSLRGSQVSKKEEGSQTQLKHSTSQGSFSRQIKDELERKAQMVVRKLCELLRNEGKSLWEIVGAASHNFISQSLLSRAQFFSIFDYLRTPLRLADKLDLLYFLKREGGGCCDLNALFDLVETPSKRRVEGDKYLLLHLVDCLETHFSSILQEALDLAFFESDQQLQAEAFLTRLSSQPFKCSRLALNEWQLLLKDEKLSKFGSHQIFLLLEGLVIKHRLNIKFSRLGFIQEMVVQLDQKGQTMYQIFPATKNFTFAYFKDYVSKISSQLNPEQEFRSLAYSLGEGKKGLQAQLPYDRAIKQIQSRIAKVRQEEGNEIQAARRLVKGLQIRRITPFEFFVSMDRNKSFFLTQQQFEVGLVELGISYDLWPDIPKKHQKRLPYNSFIQYLVSKNLLKYKSADSQVDIAMDRFLKRFLRNEDIQSVFRRLANNQNQVSFTTFQQALRRVSIETEETKLIFGVLVNEKVVRGKRWGNDEAIKDPTNIQRTFNFKQFAETVLSYRSDNLMKGPAFRFSDYFKRRSISLLFEFKKWLDGNKKIKQVAQAIKKGTQVLSKDIFLLFLNQLHSGLNDNQLKELVSRWRDEIDFHTFNSYLEDVYRKATSRVQKDQVDSYLKEMAKRIQELKVALPRLLKDFSDSKGRLGFSELSSLNDWLGTGLTKVQLRKMLTVLDSEKDGHIRGNTLAEALQNAQQTLEKDEEDCRFDYIIQKLMNNSTKFVLKNSKLAFTLQRAIIIFETLLTHDQTQLLLTQALKETKKDVITQKQMQEYVERKVTELRRQRNKKDKEISTRLLKCLQQTGIQIDQAYSYLARHHPKEALMRHEFVLLYQSLEPKSDLVQINSLFQFLQDRETGAISRSKWEQKLTMIRMEVQEQVTGSQEDLKLFYKVKVYLADVYLLFVRKAFKASQIYHYFDRHSTGLISSDELLNSLDQLGCPASPELAPKLINYLDRQRNSRISVTLVLQQLQNCLGSRIRQVISTRTSIIFRQKSKVFAQQASKFISDLAHREEINLKGDNYLSTISEASFVSLLKQFGCTLAQDEVQDVRRNFQSDNQGQLLLYPVYHAFTSLFQGPQTPSSHNQLYRRLMKAIISTGCTLGDLRQASTSRQLLAFLEQLGCFSLIQARTVVENSLFPGSQAVDFQSLKIRLRNAHLNREEGGLGQPLLVSSLKLSMTSSKETTRKQLWSILHVEILKQVVGNNRGKIDLETFENLLWECGVWVTKGTAKSYFNALAQGQHLDLSQLISLCQANLKNGNNDQGQMMMQSRVQVQDTEEQQYDGPVSLLAHSGTARVAEHIIKSLNFKGVSLEQELNKYFTIPHNYGFITHDNFLQFLIDTGLASDQLRQPVCLAPAQQAESAPNLHGLILYKDIEDFLQNYSRQAHKRPYSKPQLISVRYLQQSLKVVEKICSPLLQTPTKLYYIHSQQLASWIEQLQQINLSVQLDKLLQDRGIIDYHPSHIYRFLLQSYPNKKQLIPTLLKRIPSHVTNFQQFSQWIISFKEAHSKATNQQHIQADSNKNTANFYLFRFLKRNPIKAYQKGIAVFLSLKSLTPASNLSRMALHLFLIHLRLQSHLIILVPSLISPPKQPEPSPLVLRVPDFEYQLKAVTSLVVQEEKKLDESGLIFVNNKWLGLSVDRKYEFESMAAIANLLHSDSLFLRSKGLYLWEPPQQLLPSSSINYRWTFISIIARLVLQQLAQVHSHGYCLPHLRWNQLSKKHFIDIPVYPCPINSRGDLKLIVAEASLNFADPYCPPQFYRSQSPNYKCDSWVFGCFLYQFIYGHPPNSFLTQLNKHIEQRSIQLTLADLLEMEELPQEFEYIFYNSDKIVKKIQIEHHLTRLSSIKQDLAHYIKRQQSFSGMLLSLQLLYGEELPYFKEQISLMTQLNNTIWQCLSLNPKERPSVEQLLGMPLFQSEASRGEIDEYLNSLERHCSSEKFYESCMQPLFSAFEKGQQRQRLQKIASTCLSSIILQRKALGNLAKIADSLVIPRQYPWPKSSSQGSFSANLLNHRQQISQTANLSIMALIFNSGILDLAVLLSLTNSSLAAQTIQVLQIVKNTLKEYSPSAAFVSKILDYLLKLTYLSSRGFIQTDWESQFKDNPALSKHVGRLIRQIQRGRYWRKQTFKGETQLKSLRIIRELVLANGQGNSEYLPVVHYLDEHSNLKQLFRVVYNQMALQTQPLPAIQYFMDSLSQQSEVLVQKLCRVQMDMLPFLQKDSQCRKLTLLYFRDLLTLAPEPQVYRFPLLYLYLAHILRSPSETTTHKSVVLDIIGLCLQKSSLRRPLVQSCVGLMQQVVRLMIEPVKGTQAHKQFIQLRQKLKLIASSLLTDKDLLQEMAAGKTSWQGIFLELLETSDQVQLPIQSFIQK